VTPGTLKITATPVPYSGAAGVLGSSKHLDFARLGNRWYKMVGDHARIDATSPSTQSGRQEILSFTTTANDWNVDQMHYIWDPKQAQLALPDDAFAIARGDEIFAFVSTRTGTITQPAGVALQVDKLMAWKPGRGWRVVRDHIGEYRSGRAWRGIYDPIRDRFIVPAYFNGLVWVLIGGDGTDQTAREPNGAPKTSGNHALHVTGIAVDLPTRTAYAYDHHTSELFSVNLDTLALTKLANLPEAAASDEATFKLTWHPGLRSVIIGARKMHAYEVDSGRLTTWSRPDGYTNKIGKHVPSSTIFYDPDTQDVISIGGIDWETGMNPGVYWRLKITR
jgi:hypothetical protein